MGVDAQTIREEEDKKLAQMKKDEEDRLRREIEAKKQKEMDEKRFRLEEAERKRQEADKAAKVQPIASDARPPNYSPAPHRVIFLGLMFLTGKIPLSAQLPGGQKGGGCRPRNRSGQGEAGRFLRSRTTFTITSTTNSNL